VKRSEPIDFPRAVWDEARKYVDWKRVELLSEEDFYYLMNHKTDLLWDLTEQALDTLADEFEEEDLFKSNEQWFLDIISLFEEFDNVIHYCPDSVFNAGLMQQEQYDRIQARIDKAHGTFARMIALRLKKMSTKHVSRQKRKRQWKKEPTCNCNYILRTAPRSYPPIAQSPSGPPRWLARFKDPPSRGQALCLP
jgi:hypothetical protein